MKSKIQKNPVLKKVKVAVVITLVIIITLIAYIMSNYKTNEILIAQAEEQQRKAKNVYTSDLGSDTNPYISNEEISLYMDIDQKWGGDNFSYFGDHTRKITLKRYNENIKDWEVYSDIANGNYSYMLGDVTGDEVVDEYDAAYIWGYLAGEVAFTEIQKLAADINGNGIINNEDYQTILYMDGTYYTYKDNDGNTYNSKYLIGNPDYEKDFIYNVSGTLGNKDNYRMYIFDEGAYAENGDYTQASDARVILRLFEYGYYNEGESKAETLLRKMLSDYNMDYKIEYDDASYILRIAAQIEEDEEFERFAYKQVAFLADIEGKNYYDISIVKMCVQAGMLPKISEDGSYKVEITSLDTESIQNDIDTDDNKPVYEVNESEDPITKLMKFMNYMVEFMRYIVAKLQEMAAAISVGTYRYDISLYFTIDTTMPVCEEITYSTTEVTNENVIATLNFSELVITGDNSEKLSTKKEIIFTENGIKNITYYDKAGNEITVPVTVTNIDKTAPTITVTANKVDTAKKIELTIKSQDDMVGYLTTIANKSGTKKTVALLKNETYISGGVKEGDYVKYTLTENGIYEVVATDEAGNTARQTITIANIDNTNPTYTIVYSPSEATNEDIIANIYFSENVSVSEDQINWSAYNTLYSQTFQSNGTKTLYYKDEAGNVVTKTNEKNQEVAVPLILKVDWIDKDAPTVEITAKELDGTTTKDIINNTTNADIIRYTFTWSEEVVDFIAEDVTVNNGTKGKLSKATKNENGTYSYTMDVTTSIPEGNTGDVSVTIPSRACKDLAGGENIEQQKIIRIDKQKPTMQSYTINHEDDKIIVEAIYSEAIEKANQSSLDIYIGEYKARGEFAEPVISGNKVTYTYNISGADGGKAEIALKGTVNDIAGNTSEKINLSIENDINLEKNVIIIDGIEYSFSKNNEPIKDFLAPTYFKSGDVIKVTKVDSKNNATDYEYVIEKGKYIDNTHMKYMVLTEPEEDEEVGTVTFSTTKKTGSINIDEANIYFDTKAPTIKLSIDIEEKIENNIYTEGKEIIIVSTTSEPITNKEIIPQINISFSESGLGKYNYQGENATTGNAKYIETIENEDGTISWKYKYIVTNGDEGSLNVEYISGNIVDYAGNETDIVKEYKPTKPSSIYTKTEEFNGISISSMKFYSDSSCTKEINPLKDSYQTSDIYIVVVLNDSLYTGISTQMAKDTAPSLYLNDDIATTIQAVSSGKVMRYKYSGDTVDGLTKVEYITLKVEDCTLYTKEDLISNPNGIAVGKKYTKDTEDFYLDPVAVSNSMDLSDIVVDTTAPTLTITTDVSNPTNADVIKYTFTWSEKVEGFTADDITVNNGTKGKLSGGIQNEDGTYSYTMEVTTNIESGNTGDIQVIVEQNECQDLVGLVNARVESVIRVDKKAAIIQNVEAYAASDIVLNNEIDVVKEYYKAGENITVVVTFDENITAEIIPTLNLQFSESGNAKGTITGELNANKIIYTYTITEGDIGTVSIKSFSGEVADSAGNHTKLTKRILDGDTIIADTDIPSLVELNVLTDKGTYNAGKTITIEAIYDEEIYALENNEIKNTTSELAPILKLKFGSGEIKEVTAVGYGETDGKTDKTKIRYTYIIADGDNGVLKVTSYTNKENTKVCDIAGNEVTIKVKQTGNTITADTTRPEVTKVIAKVENPSISNTGVYHRAENKIIITLTFSERVSSVVVMPEILIGFSEDENTQPTSYNIYAYESDWNVKSTTIEYSYTIKDGDNGYLWVKVPENQFKDEAGNGNVAEDATKVSNIFADTTNPTITLLTNTDIDQTNQTITIKATYSEDVYDLDGNTKVTLTKSNAPKLIYSFGNGENKEVSASSVSGDTITYIITKDAVEDNGTLSYQLVKGNLCDRAGNLYYIENTDTTAPILESIVISSNAETYAPYCKEEKQIYVTANFNEKIGSSGIKLKAQIGDGEAFELTGVIVTDNHTQVKFTYTVKAGDNGEFKIIDISGNTDSNITEENTDNTYGWVRDVYGNQNNIYSLSDEGVTATGEAVADTKIPYVTNIKAVANNEEIVIYTKEENKDAVITVGRTNANIVEYIVTYSETVPYDHFENVSITNGIIKSIEYTDSKLNEYKITVETTIEGVQSLGIKQGIVEDKAGNTDEFLRVNAITTDFTVPTVRFISEYNGGTYVLPTNIGKAEIRPNVEISEDIASIAYKWDDGEYEAIENYSSSSDISVPTKEFTELGEYVLHIKVVDLAGNVTEASKTYKIINSSIDITLSSEEYTNQDLTTTVKFGEGLTDNKKVTFKSEKSGEIVELNAAGTTENGTTYTITENGTIYAEATDKAGNKVFTERTIENIDKEAPAVELSINGANLVIGTGKEKDGAKVKTIINVNESAIIEYCWEYKGNAATVETNWVTSKEYKTIQETECSTGAGISYLNIKVTDEAGNVTELKSNAFRVFETNEREKIIITEGEDGTEVETKEIIPAEIEISKLIAFNQEGKHISISYNNFGEGEEYLDIIKEKAITLTEERDGYIDYEYYSYVEVNKPTTITVIGKDACGNEVIATYEVKRDSIEGPEFEVIGNPEEWTNQDVKLEVVTNETLSALTVNGTDILSKDEKVRSNIVATQNGEYKFVATDEYGNISEKVISVTKIDKDNPVITKVESSGKDITITAEDTTSVVAEYAITDTTEVPVEWSESNVIKVTNDGTFYAWAKDKAGNITRAEEVVVVDTTEALDPKVVIEDLPTIQVDGLHYVKVAADMIAEDVTNKMDKEALCGLIPEYTKLAEGDKLKTGSEITLNGDTKYIVIVNGDVNCDGKVGPVDVTYANSIRLNKVNANTIQKLAADFDLDGVVKPIDITMINSYRLGKIKGI